MIDTDKYEGHTEGKWNLTPEGHIVADNMTVVCNKYTKRIVETNHKDIQLIADAPLLLEEVKRLRGILGDIIAIDEWGGDSKDVGITITWKSYEPLDEDYTFTGWLSRC